MVDERVRVRGERAMDQSQQEHAGEEGGGGRRVGE